MAYKSDVGNRWSYCGPAFFHYSTLQGYAHIDTTRKAHKRLLRAEATGEYQFRRFQLCPYRLTRSLEPTGLSFLSVLIVFFPVAQLGVGHLVPHEATTKKTGVALAAAGRFCFHWRLCGFGQRRLW